MSQRPIMIEEVCWLCWEKGRRTSAWLGNPCERHSNQHDTVKLLGDEPVDITMRADWTPDPNRIAKAIAGELEANSLGDMKRDIVGLKEDVSSMAEDLVKVMDRTEEIPLINQRLSVIEDHLVSCHT